MITHAHGTHERHETRARRRIRLPRLVIHLRRGRRDDLDAPAEEAAHNAAWQREVVAPGPPAEFGPVTAPVTEAPPLAPLPAPVRDWQPRPGIAARVPVTFRTPEPETVTDLPPIPDRGSLAGHVAAILARPARPDLARAELARFVDAILSPWADSTGSFTAVTHA